MIFLRIKIILLWSILLLLLSACEEKPKFTMDLSDFFNLDKNTTYVYKMIDTHEVNGKVEPLMPERYMEKHVYPVGNNCINIQSYVLFNDKDIKQMDKGLRAQLKDNKFRTIDEKYCVDGNTIKINGGIHMDLDKEWNMVSKSIPADGSKLTENKIECQVVDVSKKVVLSKKRKIIHTQCTGELFETMDWSFVENIGLYKMKIVSTFPEFHSQSTNEVILVREKLER